MSEKRRVRARAAAGSPLSGQWWVNRGERGWHVDVPIYDTEWRSGYTAKVPGTWLVPDPDPLPPQPPDGSVVEVLDDKGRRDSLWIRDDGLDAPRVWLSLTTGDTETWAGVCGSGSTVRRLVAIPDPDDDKTLNALALELGHHRVFSAPSHGTRVEMVRAVLDALRDGTRRAEP